MSRLWAGLGSIQAAVREGLQEFGQDALKETGLLKQQAASRAEKSGSMAESSEAKKESTSSDAPDTTLVYTGDGMSWGIDGWDSATSVPSSKPSSSSSASSPARTGSRAAEPRPASKLQGGRLSLTGKPASKGTLGVRRSSGKAISELGDAREAGRRGGSGGDGTGSVSTSPLAATMSAPMDSECSTNGDGVGADGMVPLELGEGAGGGGTRAAEAPSGNAVQGVRDVSCDAGKLGEAAGRAGGGDGRGGDGELRSVEGGQEEPLLVPDSSDAPAPEREGTHVLEKVGVQHSVELEEVGVSAAEQSIEVGKEADGGETRKDQMVNGEGSAEVPSGAVLCSEDGPAVVGIAADPWSVGGDLKGSGREYVEEGDEETPARAPDPAPEMGATSGIVGGPHSMAGAGWGAQEQELEGVVARLREEKAEMERALQGELERAEREKGEVERVLRGEVERLHKGSGKAEQELERLRLLCRELQSSVDTAAKDREELAKRLRDLEDELESEKAKGKSLEAEIADMEAGADEEFQEIEERAEKAEEELKVLRKKLDTLEASDKKKEAKIQQLQAEARTVGEERGGALRGLEEARKQLREAANERARLEAELAEKDTLAEQTAAELDALQDELEVAKREAAESSVKLADAMAELRAERQAASARAAEEGERSRLESDLAALTSTVQTATAEVEGWKQRCTMLEKGAREAQNRVKAVEAELALAQHRVFEAEADAQEARRLRAEAEGTTEQLREATERRAMLFNAAVKAAVAKIQGELEEERDSALAHVKDLEAAAAAATEQLIALQEQLVALEAASEVSRAEMEAKQREQEELRGALGAAQEAVAAAEKRVEEAGGREHELRAAWAALEAKISEAEARCQTLGDDVAGKQGQLASLEERLAEAEREKTSLKVALLEASTKGAEDTDALRCQLDELQARLRLAESRHARAPPPPPPLPGASGSAPAGTPPDAAAAPSQRLGPTGSAEPLPAQPAPGKALEDLGLESVRWGDKLMRLDLEMGPSEGRGRSRFSARRWSHAANMSDAGAPTQPLWGPQRQADAQRPSIGRISRRSLILVAYVVLLHIMVMVSFTHRSAPACSDVMDLPGR